MVKPSLSTAPESIPLTSLVFLGLDSLKEYAFCILSQQGVVLYSNQGIENICGYSPTAFIGQGIQRLYPSVNTTDLFADILQQLTVDTPFKVEQWLKRSDSSLFLASMTFTLIASDGAPPNYSLILFDRTQAYEQEILLREKEKRYEYVIDGVHAGIWDWNIKEDYCYWSPYFLEIFGINPNEITCFNTAINHIHPDDQQKVIDKMQSHIANPDEEYEVEYRITRPSGEIRHCLSRGRAIQNDAGDVLRVVGAVIDITQQKRAEAEIKLLHNQLEKRFSATFQQAAVGFAHVGLNSVWQRVNTKLCEIFGYTEAELTKLTYQEITYAEDLPNDIEQVRKILADEISTYSIEKRFIRKDGSLVWANLTVSLLRDNYNNPEYFISVIEDISQRKNAELKLQLTFQQLQENEARLNRIIHSNIAGIFFSSLDNVIFDANDNFLKMIGYTREEIISGKITRTAITPIEYQESDRLILKELTQKGFVNNYEKQYIRRNGKRIDVLINHILLKQTRTEAVAFVLDITERKSAEQALLESEQRFRKMADEAPIMLWMTDHEGKTIYANKYWLDYVGLTLEQYTGQFRPDTEAIHLEDRARAKALLIESVQQQKTYTATVRYRRSDGEYRWISINGNPRFTPSGDFVGHVGICQDVTESKLARDKLKKFARELEQRVDERTREIQLVNKELEAFSYSVSHDLRAPLRSIDGFSNIIATRYADALDPQGKEYFRFIRENTQRMGQLIDDLLQLSRISRVELDLHEINLSQMAEEITKYIQLQSPTREVKFFISPNIIANADPRLLRIVLDNLLDNAWKFTGKIADAAIEFSAYNEAEQTIYVVRDNGAGFDMKFANKLFGAFQRLHSMDEFPGTGIGLATVLRIIHRHKGRVWASGEPGKGATFYFTLPQTTHD